jgi:diamine N-acetyltransferase
LNSSIELQTISPDNYELALGLSVRTDQEEFVASVQKSLADAYVYPEASFRLALLDHIIVGYVLIFPVDSDSGRTVNIVRLMIDQRYQGQGLGRQLLEVTLHWIQALEPKVQRVRISTLPQNARALSLYESVGFVRSGMEDDELALCLELPPNGSGG